MRQIPPFQLDPIPLDDEAKTLPSFKWADESVGKRHQLGGKPSFLQQTHWPKCPDCNESMSFYSQLDSINDEFCIADCGMIYIFICFECNTTTSFIQSY